jgi:hypothetical protein
MFVCDEKNSTHLRLSFKAEDLTHSKETKSGA